MELVCFQGSEVNSFGQIKALVNRGDWENVIIIREKGSEDIVSGDNCEIIEVDLGKSLMELRDILILKLKEKLGKEFEVALSIASGTGKEHMALISALLSVPVGIRLVAFTKKGVEFIN